MTEQEFQKIKDRDEACKAGRRIRDAGQFAERDRSVLIAEVERLRVCEIFSDIDRRLSEENLELVPETKTNLPQPLFEERGEKILRPTIDG